MANVALTTTSTSIQTWTITASVAQIEAIGQGGGGSARQSTTVAGNGGSGGEYARRNTATLYGTTAYFYINPSSGTPADTWFDDLNQLTQSGTVTNAAWNNGGVTLTLNATTAPDGSGTAFSMACQAVTTSPCFVEEIATSWVASRGNVLATQNYTSTVYAKPNQSGIFAIVFCNIGSVYVAQVFDVTNGVLGESSTVGGTVTRAEITTDSLATGKTGNGWYRCTLVAQVSSQQLGYYMLELANTATGNTWVSDGTINITAAANAKGLYFWGPQIYFGDTGTGNTKPYAATTTNGAFTVLAKCGANATTSAAGVHQTGGQGDVVNEGGDGFKTTTSAGGGAGGAAGPNGAGSTATSLSGGNADGGTVAGPTSPATGNGGTEFDATHGCGTGAAGNNSTTGNSGNGYPGGSYGGGGSGSSTKSGAVSGNGQQGMIYITPSGDVLMPQILT